jgi:hypothetical protein
MKRFSVFPLLFLSLLFFGCGNNNTADTGTNTVSADQNAAAQPTGKMVFIYASSGLNMRKTPSLEGEKLTKVPYGAAVEVLEDSNPPVTMTYEGLKGKWIYVKFGADKGYVFEGFMGRLPVPQPGVTFFDYFRKNFAPLKKIVTNEYRNEDNGDEVFYTLDVDFFYDMGIIIKKYEYSEGGDETVTIPDMTIQEAFVFLKLFNIPTLKGISFPTKSYSKSADPEHYISVNVETENNEITTINISVNIEFVVIKKDGKNKVKIVIGSGA